MSNIPLEKRPCLLDKSKCGIYIISLGTGKNKTQSIKNPTIDRIMTILDVAQARNDDVYSELSPWEDDLKLEHWTFLSANRTVFLPQVHQNNYIYKQDVQVAIVS